MIFRYVPPRLVTLAAGQTASFGAEWVSLATSPGSTLVVTPPEAFSSIPVTGPSTDIPVDQATVTPVVAGDGISAYAHMAARAKAAEPAHGVQSRQPPAGVNSRPSPDHRPAPHGRQGLGVAQGEDHLTDDHHLEGKGPASRGRRWRPSATARAADVKSSPAVAATE